MKVLSLSTTAEAQDTDTAKMPPVVKQTAKPSTRKTILRAFGVRQDGDRAPVISGDAGMEDTVLGRMQGQDLSAQMKEFHTAYSKVSTSRGFRCTWKKIYQQKADGQS